MTDRYDRRTFLRRAGLAGAGMGVAGALAARPAAAADEALAPFLHGVASGDPAADSVVLWTAITPHDGTTADVEVGWEIAADPDFTAVVGSGTVTATAANGFTVKPIATGLAPFTYHWYRFTALGRTSIVGRTKTAPAAGQAAVDRLRFGLVSCSNYEGGYFNAYARLAERNDLDAVICCGDYLYEYGQGGYGPGADIGRVVEPELEMTTLEEYRARFGHYRLDPDLRRLHQLYPWINTWDDHETTNDSWRGGAENHDDGDNPAEQGLDWEERKRRAWKAYREWLPVRVPADDPDEPIVLYRSLAFGDLADLVVMDTRIEGRDEQAFEVLEPGLFETTIDDPERRMISPAQQAFVTDALSSSTAAWRVLVQQVMMMQWRIGSMPEGLAGNDFPVFGTTTGGNSVNGDAWDGYNAERRRLFEFLRQEDVTDVVVLTGDIHSAWAADLTEDPLDPLTYDPTGQNPSVPRNLGVEFVCTSVTSDNIDEIVMGQGGPRELGVATARALETATLAENPHIKSVELESHGYGIIDVTDDRTTYDVFFTPVILEPSDDEVHHESWYVERSGPDVAGHRVVQAEAPTESRTDVPAAPDAEPAPHATTTTTSTTLSPTTGDGPTLPATGGAGWLLAGATAAAGAVIARRAATSDEGR